MNPFIDPKKFARSVAPQLTKALDNPVQALMNEIQKANPEVLGRLMKLYKEPQKTLCDIFTGNPDMQKQITEQMKGLSLKDQQNFLVTELQNSGINVRAIAAKFGISL